MGPTEHILLVRGATNWCQEGNVSMNARPRATCTRLQATHARVSKDVRFARYKQQTNPNMPEKEQAVGEAICLGRAAMVHVY